MPDGWQVSPADRKIIELIPFGSSKLKASRDVLFHICANSARIICLYKPDPGT